MKLETNERDPAKWGDSMWSAILAILAAYIRKWSGEDSPATLSPEARDEIRSRIVLDVIAQPVPEGFSALRHVFRIARQWRVRGWTGDTALDQREKRAARRAARAAARDPGSKEAEERRNKSPFRGVSDDARQPTPLAQLVAIESATREGLAYVSDRQRKQRRRAVSGKPSPVRHRVRIVGFVGKPRVGFGSGGRPLYFPGAATRIAFEPLAPEGERYYCRKTRKWMPHPGHIGSIANRAIGKAKTDAIGQDAIGQAMVRMAIIGRTEGRRFIPSQPPTVGIPAQPGDGSAIRPIRQ